MKKALIAGAASLAVAAMPVVGVFAADGTLSQTDTVVVTVDSACSLATSGASVTPDASTYTATIANNGMNNNIAGSTLTITCNDTNGWFLTAVGAQTDGDVNRMDASTKADDDIASLATPNIAENATTSNWAFKLAAGTGDNAGATIEGNYDAFSQVPTAAKTVATGTATSAGTAQVTATYGVAINATQAAGTYTGKVTYTLGHPKSSAPTNS